MMIRPAMREYRTWGIDSTGWDAYAPRPGDIIIATAPKCGTTWMQQIVSSLVFRDATVHALPTVSPWLDARVGASAAEMHKALATQTHRRFPKSHLPIDGLPLYDEVRYIHVARDGRDAFMSMHNHFTGYSEAQLASFDRIGLADPAIARPYPRPPTDPAEYFRLWMSTGVVAGQTDGTPAPSFFDTEIGYWAERRRGNFLLVHYNDLAEDREAEMRRIAGFLEIEIEETAWPALVRAAGFEEMRAAGDALAPFTTVLFAEGSRRFFNKGTNGRWRDVLTERDLALYDGKIRAKFTPGLAAWLEGGRRTAGDPRESAD